MLLRFHDEVEILSARCVLGEVQFNNGAVGYLSAPERVFGNCNTRRSVVHQIVRLSVYVQYLLTIDLNVDAATVAILQMVKTSDIEIVNISHCGHCNCCATVILQ